MQFNKNKFLRISAGLIAAGSMFILGISSRNSQLFMPKEYKLIKTIINKFARKNDLGDRKIYFKIITGQNANYMAKELGLCKVEKYCYYFSMMDPFKKYNNQEKNEITNISYLMNVIEGKGSANGIVYIARSTFQAFDNNEVNIAFVLGHELHHALTGELFKYTKILHEESKGLNEEKYKDLKNFYTREWESNADIYAIKLLNNSGYTAESGYETLKLSGELIGTFPRETKNDKHMHIVDRINYAKQFIENEVSELPEPENGKKGKWKYNRNLNHLTFDPSK